MMEIRSRSRGRHVTLEFSGELDHHAAKRTITEMARLLDASLPLTLTLDFSGVTFMDSSGIALVLRAQRNMEALGGKTEVVNVPAQPKRVFDAAGIYRLLPIRAGGESR